MQIRFGVLAAILLMTSLANAASLFCLQNFNVYGPIYAPAVENRTAFLTDELKNENPRCDVLQFQEVWTETHERQIQDALGVDYAVSAPNLENRIGLMSLFEGRILDRQTFLFHLNDEGGILDGIRRMTGVEKAFHVVRAQLNAIGEEMYFLNTHLHPTSEAIRLTQILDIYRWRLGHQDRKFVLSGDFNAEIGSLERALVIALLGVHDSMEEVLGGTYPLNFCSYCADNPHSWLSGNHLFDYIFYSNVSESPDSLRALRGEINLKGQNGYTLSDHYGVRVYLGLDNLTTAVPSLEIRRGKALSIIDKSLAKLRAENSRQYARDVRDLQDIRSSLEQRQGFYWEYFARYR